jgi:hypothetical protein
LRASKDARHERWPVVLRGSLSLAPQDDGGNGGAGERHPDPELARASVSKDEAQKWATWPSSFETALGRLLTMRVL